MSPTLITATLLTTLLFTLLTAVSAQSNDYGWHFGNALSTGPVGSGNWIRESNTTLILPATNKPQTGNLALWPGMGTDGGDLVQALAISLKENSCGAGEGQWCVVASTLEESQQMGEYVAADAGDHVTMNYKYNDDTGKYDQTVSINGEVVSQISTKSGHAEGWGTAVECQSAACGVAPAHEYVDTVIIMDGADPNYDQTQGTTGATGQIVTSDGGKTWTAESIKIEASTFN